jgi:undecaprenyl-diphosphatase
MVGFAAALISGVVAIKWLLAMVRRGRLGLFAAYCIVVGLIVLVAASRG